MGPHARVLTQVSRWLAEGHRVWLCTIVSTWGSSPRPPGSWLAVNEQGDWAGSVSGGCLEQDLLQRCVSECPAKPQVIDYGISDNDRDRFRLPCGGHIRLLVEPLFPERDFDHVQSLQAGLSERVPVRRLVSLEGGGPVIDQAVAALPGIQEAAREISHTLVPECRLLLIGAGEVTHYVADFALAADFLVTLCEPRPEFARGWRNTQTELVRTLPDDLVYQSFADHWAGVLALAHDPRVDDLALLAALNTDAFYVGAMGSLKTSTDRKARLGELGLTADQLARLRAPVGIDIPSKTPAEIAVSIVADLISARHRLRQSRSSL